MSVIADKIRKIIAKADSSEHPEEAMAFLDKAQRMMEEHGLSLLDLGRLNSDDPVGTDKEFYRGRVNDSWRQMVAPQLAEFFGCRMVITHKGDNKWHSVTGRESARITYQLMWPFVDRQVMAIARRDVAAGKYKTVNAARRQIGYALAIRIAEMNRAHKPVQAEGLSQANTLVPVDLIRAAMAEAFPDLRSMGAKTVRFDHNATRSAAEVSLHRQAGADRSALKIGG